jgi:peptide/nickel transport system permease protein
MLRAFLVIWGIVTLLFTIFYTLGDPVEYLVEEGADEATKEAIRAKYGLDQPLLVQYGRYLNQLSPLGSLSPADAAETAHLPLWKSQEGVFALKSPGFGRSYQTGRPVAAMLGEKIEGTLILALAAILFAALLGISLGVIASLHYNSFWDRSILSFSVLGISAPSFFVGVFVAWLFAVQWREWTGLNATGYLFEEAIFTQGRYLVLKNLFLPALALGIRPLAVFIQLTRSSMLDALKTDYVRTAHAKGLSPRVVLFRHALRNALNPVITSMTGWLASLLAGAFFIEYIFNWQGIGKLIIDALNTKDFPVIVGGAIFIGVVFVLISLLTDWLYRVLDPRIRG